MMITIAMATATPAIKATVNEKVKLLIFQNLMKMSILLLNI